MNVDLFYETDFVYIGRRDGELLSGIRAAVVKQNLSYTEYDRKTFHNMYPQFNLRENEIALVNHGAGLVYPEQSIKTFLTHAEKNGAKILENSKVLSWTELDDGVRIVLEDGSIIEASQVVVTIGAFTE